MWACFFDKGPKFNLQTCGCDLPEPMAGDAAMCVGQLWNLAKLLIEVISLL